MPNGQSSADQLNELEIAERVLTRFGGKPDDGREAAERTPGRELRRQRAARSAERAAASKRAERVA